MADDKLTETPMGEPLISILALSDVHLQMLRALQAAVRILDVWDDLTIVGGLGRFFGGTALVCLTGATQAPRCQSCPVNTSLF